MLLCPYGVAGYIISGCGWQIMIPNSSIIYGHGKINTFLDFLGMTISVFLTIMDTIKPHPCVLALGDSTSAIRWMFNTSKL
jgi:hypothetical protein